MSVFLERQKVRKQKAVIRSMRRLKRTVTSFLIVGSGCALLYAAYLVIFSSPLFAVREILVRGTWKHIDADALAKLSGVEVGTNLFALDVETVQQRLHENVWIRRAAVRRHPPHTLLIFVEEYEPAAIVAADKLFFIDAEGVVFKLVEAADEKGYPVLTGMAATDDERLRQALEIATTADRMSPLGHAVIAEVNYHEVRGYSLVIDTGSPIAILVGNNDIEERLRNLKMVEEDIRSRGRIWYIVANDPERIVVRYKG
ncbi:MAG: FtsQ-type POTRA domain-containing protein [Deltaproteobacteria bacterium]|nr:FtsQ-type POTRA domain-containing protein [Deltaproteobacteria bacterium]